MHEPPPVRRRHGTNGSSSYEVRAESLLATSAEHPSSCKLLPPLLESRSTAFPPGNHGKHHQRCTCVRASDIRAQASEARLYQFSPETTSRLTKFRLSTSRSKTPQALILTIDKKTFEIKPSPDVYTSMDDVSEDLPEHAPRFVLLSYPLTLEDGRASVPYVMLNWMPITVGTELKMLYAGAKELARNTAEVGKVIDVADEDELAEVPELLKAGGGR